MLVAVAYWSGLPVLSSSIAWLNSRREMSLPLTEPTTLGSPKNLDPPDLNKSPKRKAMSATKTTTTNSPERFLMF